MSRTPRRVVWGLGVIGATFTPSIVLSRVDLPTFGLPTMDTKPDLVGAAPARSRGARLGAGPPASSAAEASWSPWRRCSLSSPVTGTQSSRAVDERTLRARRAVAVEAGTHGRGGPGEPGTRGRGPWPCHKERAPRERGPRRGCGDWI